MTVGEFISQLQKQHPNGIVSICGCDDFIINPTEHRLGIDIIPPVLDIKENNLFTGIPREPEDNGPDSSSMGIVGTA